MVSLGALALQGLEYLFQLCVHVLPWKCIHVCVLWICGTHMVIGCFITDDGGPHFNRDCAGPLFSLE